MIKSVILILFLLAMAATAHPQEAKGIVTKILDGSTFEVGTLGCVRLADIVSVPASSMSGLKAREFTRDTIANTQVFLDIDNQTGQDKDGCWMCVVYKAYPNGTPNMNANFNQMYVNAGYGRISDNPDTEFDPANWSDSRTGDNDK
jgi:endonuclease YncB( thermonuclease family)